MSDRDDLKQRSATALERALAFVSRRGDDLARLRMGVLLEVEPRESLADAVARSLEGDGQRRRLEESVAEALGFEDLTPHLASGAPGALDRLRVLAEARLMTSAAAQRLEERLRESQNEDGSWGAPETAAEDRLHLTGALTGLLARMRCARPTTLVPAVDFLGALWSPERVEGGRWSAILAFAHGFGSGPHELSDEALQWCGRELERGFRTRRFDGLLAALVAVECDADALPAFQVSPVELLEALLGEQARDGGFAELAPSAAGRVTATVGAARAILALNRSF